MFNKLFGKKNSNQKDTVIEFKDGTKMDFDIYWLQRELEFQHQPKKIQFRTNENHSLKFGEVVNSLFDIRKEELSILTINDGTLNNVEGDENIWNYEFLQHYKRNENGEYCYYREGCSNLANQIVLTLAYRTYEQSLVDNDQSTSKKDALLIVHLQYPYGLKDKALYIQATFCRPIITLERSKKGINPQPECLSILIGYDYKPSDDLSNEFFKIFNSAKEKVNSGKINELDYLERELIEVLNHPQIAKEFYFAKKVMAESRFWDAIEYFNNAFQATQKHFWDDSKEFTGEEFDFLVECSFLMGFCYYELGLFDKAYKYLEFSSRSNIAGYKYQTEFINCLISLHDIRSMNLIDNHLQNISSEKYANKTQSEKDLDFAFLLFLFRRKAYLFIEFREYENASIWLNKILELDPNSEFAKKEIEYIKQLKINE